MTKVNIDYSLMTSRTKPQEDTLQKVTLKFHNEAKFHIEHDMSFPFPGTHCPNATIRKLNVFSEQRLVDIKLKTFAPSSKVDMLTSLCFPDSECALEILNHKSYCTL